MRRSIRAALAAVAVGLAVAAAGDAAPRMTVDPSTDIDPEGQKVRVRGSGYDPEMGVYVAWCVVPPAGQKPTPCGGGDDRTGESGSSVWISSNPAYGAALAKPYGPDGSFDVTILVSRRIGDVDCFVTACAVTTRNDHENTEDRSQDVFVPVRFRGQPSTTKQAPSSSTSSTGPAAAPTAGPTTSTSSPTAQSAATDAPQVTVPVPAAELATGSTEPPRSAPATVAVSTEDDGGAGAGLGAGVAVAALAGVAGIGAAVVRRRRA